MLRMLNLAGAILKYCSLLVLLRVLVTAFGWEFGITRQYLRLLELLFQLGQRRIEKVESRHKLATERPQLDLEPDSKLDGKDATGEVERRRRNGISGDGQVIRVAEQATKSRRISTPDGPPVFLFDQDEEEEEEEEEGEKDEADFAGNNNEQEESCANCSDRQVAATGSGGRRHEFQLEDACQLVVRGVSAIIDDQVTKRFTRAELSQWNLLTRTNSSRRHQFMSRSLSLYWSVGFLFRYCLLLPLRIIFTLTGSIWLCISMALIGLLPPPLQRLKAKLHRVASLMAFRTLACGITSRLEFHNRQFRAREGDVCVANHTSPIDVVLLACDNCYALVGQRHGGLLGILEHALSRATNHVWFDRGEMRDRQLVTQRLKKHVEAKSNLPVLIFPEGTCINNSAVMLFRKGSFETTDRVCPVTLKYDSRFGDPFWNSSKQSYIVYLFMLMSSWAIKCDVWYLPPMDRHCGESSAEFAARVKAEIARQGGLDDLNWDGQLKRTAPKELWKYQQQEDYVGRLKLE